MAVNLPPSSAVVTESGSLKLKFFSFITVLKIQNILISFFGAGYNQSVM
jgi:hypothetical protein